MKYVEFVWIFKKVPKDISRKSVCEVFFFKQKTAYEIGVRLVGSEMCIRDRILNDQLRRNGVRSSDLIVCVSPSVS